MDATRIDKWLWAVRIAKTRSSSTELCRGGHVKVNGVSVKPSSSVRPGDKVIARVGDRERVVEVVEIIEKRVGAAIAATCLIDHSPVRPTEDRGGLPIRDASAGRPTKRDRRRLDDLRGR